MHPATRNISDEQQRGLVVKDAWESFNWVQIGALSVMALTWFAGRTQLSGREVDATSRKLTVLKDVLVIGSVATAVGSAIAGRRMAAQEPEGVPIDDTGMKLTPDASPKAKSLSAVTGTFGVLNILCGAGVMAVTTVLAMRAGKSGKWSIISRMLP